jgi:hypothetical protein
MNKKHPLAPLKGGLNEGEIEIKLCNNPGTNR